MKTLFEILKDLWTIFVTEPIHDFGIRWSAALLLSNSVIFGLFALFILPRFITLYLYGLMGLLLVGALSLLVPATSRTR